LYRVTGKCYLSESVATVLLPDDPQRLISDDGSPLHVTSYVGSWVVCLLRHTLQWLIQTQIQIQSDRPKRQRQDSQSLRTRRTFKQKKCLQLASEGSVVEVGAPGEVHFQAKSPIARYELTFHHLVTFTMRFVTYNIWHRSYLKNCLATATSQLLAV